MTCPGCTEPSPTEITLALFPLNLKCRISTDRRFIIGIHICVIFPIKVKYYIVSDKHIDVAGIRKTDLQDTVLEKHDTWKNVSEECLGWTFCT